MYNMNMLALSFVSWWYTKGLSKRVDKLEDGFRRNLDYFSFGLLLKTLFAPFRQIDAGKLTNAPVDVKMHKFFDRLVSRFVGAFMRILVILAGIVVMVFQTIFYAITVMLHLVLPVLPVVGVVMMVIGWVPVWPF